jgi:RNA polymerase primary sigma factor
MYVPAEEEEASCYRQLAKTPLLTFEQEQTLFALLAEAQSAQAVLDGNPPPDTPALLALHRAVAVGDDAKARLVASNIRLVYQVANVHTGRGLSWSDLVQEGMEGLLIAIGKFEASRGLKFSTYATFWIRQRIIRSVEDDSRTIRLPVHINADLRKMQRAEAELARLGAHPAVADIAMSAGLSPAKVEHLRHLKAQYDSGCASLDARLETSADDTTMTLYDVLTSPAADPAAIAIQRSQRREIDRLLDRLDTRSRQLLELRHGLDGAGPRTLDEVGRHLGITRERVRQIEKEALGALRAAAQPLREVA